MSVDFIKPTPDALAHIAQNMRPEDVREVWLTGHYTPRGALDMSVQMSDLASVACINGEPCAAFGLRDTRSLLTGTGVPWLLGTTLIDKHARLFVRHTKIGIEEMLERCPRLVNHVHIENHKSIKWLRLMGFTFDDPRPFGVEGALFMRFELCANPQQ